MDWGWRFPQGTPAKHFCICSSPWDCLISSTNSAFALSGPFRFVALMQGNILLESKGIGKGCTTTFFVKLGISHEWKHDSTSALLPVNRMITICGGNLVQLEAGKEPDFGIKICGGISDGGDVCICVDFCQIQRLLHYCSCGWVWSGHVVGCNIKV
jgi:hypothetical protein